MGDMGPKFGYNGVDNGYLRLQHVRIRKLGSRSGDQFGPPWGRGGAKLIKGRHKAGA